MSQQELADDLRRFILSSIPSVPYLEAVLLLRSQPADSWDAATLARRLYVPERTGRELVAQLEKSGIAAAAPAGVRYAPATETAAIIDRMAAAYAANLVTVTGLIHSRIDRRAHQFADAFRFRKE
ncbi:MAG: hypothetical protein JWP41_659 [Ramlibacter sp.]|jgi:hypothetical protein|nr:hypothetical protein [Ramlibacter sp.]